MLHFSESVMELTEMTRWHATASHTFRKVSWSTPQHCLQCVLQASARLDYSSGSYEWQPDGAQRGEFICHRVEVQVEVDGLKLVSCLDGRDYFLFSRIFKLIHYVVYYLIFTHLRWLVIAFDGPHWWIDVDILWQCLTNHLLPNSHCWQRTAWVS